MLIDLIKFLHILFAIILLGAVFFSVSLHKKITAPPANFFQTRTHLQRLFILAALCAGITGSLLIYPKHYTLHTHWIQAAYFLLICFISLMTYFKKIHSRTIWLGYCTLLFFILMTIIHDAVSKKTFF